MIWAVLLGAVVGMACGLLAVTPIVVALAIADPLVGGAAGLLIAEAGTALGALVGYGIWRITFRLGEDGRGSSA